MSLQVSLTGEFFITAIYFTRPDARDRRAFFRPGRRFLLARTVFIGVRLIGRSEKAGEDKAASDRKGSDG